MYQMPSVEVRYYQPFDYRGMKFRDKDEFENITKANPSYFLDLPRLCCGNAFTIFKDGAIIALTGWVPSCMNFAEVWFFASENLEFFFDKDVLRSIKDMMEVAHQQHERLQTTCKEDKRNKRFLEFMGFSIECLMKKYGFDGEDMYLYASIRK
jgi:hypothetical protein